MKHTLISPLRRAAAFVLAVLLAVPAVYAAAGERKLQTSVEVLDGLTYRNTVTVNNDSRVESFSLELSPGGQVSPILLQGSGAVYGAATINKAVSTAQELGYHVVGAVNTDFFSMSSGVPMGIVIEDGIYKSSGGDENAMLITGNQVSITGRPQVSLTLTNQSTGQETVPHHFNKLRSPTGGLYLYNSHFSSVSTRSSGAGWYVRMEAAGGQAGALTVNSTLELVVTELIRSPEPLAIGEHEYILTADDVSGYDFIYNSFQVGDQITLRTACQDQVLSQAQWAGGVGDIMVWDGAVTDSSTWTYAKDGRQPRTAMGMRSDGTLVLYAVDGRQSGYSSGLSQLDLAGEMKAQGCVWAVNLDGGGSTALSLWLPGQAGPAIQSSPSGGSPRSCATYLLLVTGHTGSGQASRLALPQQGQAVLAGTSLTLPQPVSIDAGLNIVDEHPGGVRMTAELGRIEDGVYTAGEHPGTDTISLRQRDGDLEGSAQIHVVDHLTGFTVSRQGEEKPLTALTVKPGEQVQLAVSGSYWGRQALRDWQGVRWSMEGELGTLDETGLFTAAALPSSGSITFSCGGLTQTIIVTMTNLHTDVTPEHWAYEAVEYCYEHNIVSGVSTTEFGRDAQIRRGDFMLMLHNALGKPAPAGPAQFTDVAESDYYYTALSWAQGAGLASGTGDGAYSPSQPITREQAFTILRQALPLLGKQCPDGELSVLEQFADRDLIASYAQIHTATLVSQGIVSGKGEGIDPRGDLTRAEMAAILYKAITFTPVTETPADPSVYTLTLDQQQLILAPGERTVLTASVTGQPAPQEPSFTWTCSTPAAAVVDASGAVTSIHAGLEEQTAIITAHWRGLSASCVVTCSPPQRVGVVTGAEDGLNVRSGPGTSFDVLTGLDNSVQVAVLGEESGWYQIVCLSRDGAAVTGYVSGDYLTVIP